MQQQPQNTQIKVGDEVEVFGYGYAAGHEEEDDSLHLFSGEKGTVKRMTGMMVKVNLLDPEDIPSVEVHYYQLVPKKNLI